MLGFLVHPPDGTVDNDDGVLVAALGNARSQVGEALVGAVKENHRPLPALTCLFATLELAV